MIVSPAMMADYTALILKVDDLKAENAELKRELGLNRDAARVGLLSRRWKLTGHEADVLLTLYDTRDRTITKTGLMNALYHGALDEPDIRIIDIWICRLRRKLGFDHIQTIWGRGFRLTEVGVSACAEALGESA